MRKSGTKNMVFKKRKKKNKKICLVEVEGMGEFVTNTFEYHVRRLVDIFFDCGSLQVLEMETIKICEENNFDVHEMVKHVQWMIEDLA